MKKIQNNPPTQYRQGGGKCIVPQVSYGLEGGNPSENVSRKTNPHNNTQKIAPQKKIRKAWSPRSTTDWKEAIPSKYLAIQIHSKKKPKGPKAIMGFLLSPRAATAWKGGTDWKNLHNNTPTKINQL